MEGGLAHLEHCTNASPAKAVRLLEYAPRYTSLGRRCRSGHLADGARPAGRSARRGTRLIIPAYLRNNLPYLRLLAKQYPSIRAASSEIIDLSANLQLPKGTEHFLSDIHGEYEAFSARAAQRFGLDQT